MLARTVENPRLIVLGCALLLVAGLAALAALPTTEDPRVMNWVATVLTPFPHTQTFDDLESQGRILHKDWSRYTAGEVVYRPKQMTPDKLQELFHYAWEEFYRNEPQQVKMARLLKTAIRREMANGTRNRFPGPGKSSSQ